MKTKLLIIILGNVLLGVLLLSITISYVEPKEVGAAELTPFRPLTNTPIPTQIVKPLIPVIPDTTECGVSKKYPHRILKWCDLITHYARRRNLPPDLVAALIWQESGGNPTVISSSGAVGLMQVMPNDGLAATFICQNGPCFSNRPSIKKLKNPEFNISYGTGMLARLMKKHGDKREALKAYGPMNVGYYYSDKVIGIFKNNKD